MRRGVGIAVVGSSLLAFSPAHAESIEKSVPGDRSTKIDHYTGWNDDCSFKEISVDVIANPSHGTVTHHIANGRIPAEAKIGSSGACAGKPTQVLELFYRPTRGFRGVDGFSVNLRVGSSPAHVFEYRLTVQ
jgi:hypothetical protein